MNYTKKNNYSYKNKTKSYRKSQGGAGFNKKIQIEMIVQGYFNKNKFQYFSKVTNDNLNKFLNEINQIITEKNNDNNDSNKLDLITREQLKEMIVKKYPKIIIDESDNISKQIEYKTCEPEKYGKIVSWLNNNIEITKKIYDDFIALDPNIENYMHYCLNNIINNVEINDEKIKNNAKKALEFISPETVVSLRIMGKEYMKKCNNLVIKWLYPNKFTDYIGQKIANPGNPTLEEYNNFLIESSISERELEECLKIIGVKNPKTSVVTPQVAPTDASVVTPQVAPTDASVVTPQVAPTDTSVVNPQVAPADASVVTPQVAPTDTSVVTPQVAPTDTSIVNPQVAPADASVVTPQSTILPEIPQFTLGSSIEENLKELGIDISVKLSTETVDITLHDKSPIIFILQIVSDKTKIDAEKELDKFKEYDLSFKYNYILNDIINQLKANRLNDKLVSYLNNKKHLIEMQKITNKFLNEHPDKVEDIDIIINFFKEQIKSLKDQYETNMKASKKYQNNEHDIVSDMTIINKFINYEIKVVKNHNEMLNILKEFFSTIMFNYWISFLLSNNFEKDNKNYFEGLNALPIPDIEKEIKEKNIGIFKSNDPNKTPFTAGGDVNNIIKNTIDKIDEKIKKNNNIMRKLQKMRKSRSDFD